MESLEDRLLKITHDITNLNVRKNLIEEIESNENLYRKEESFRRFEIYRDRQEKYILQKLASDVSVESVRDMRTFTSINLTKKMIHEQASLYLREPTREFTDLNDAQIKNMLAHYKYSRANVEYKNSNRMYKLHDQCAIKYIPKDGFIDIDVLQPHHYDVVPSKVGPEKGEIYIISSFNRDRVANDNDYRNYRNSHENRFFGSNNSNEDIADADDWKSENKIYYWWNALYNFKTNSAGLVLDPNTLEPMKSVNYDDLENPISELNFVDVACEKDFEFWVRSGDSVTEFNVDFGVVLSDAVNINKNQGFAIPIITSVEAPRNLKVGSDRAIWLKIDPNDEAAQRPSFDFATPNPDLAGTLKMTEDLLKYFLVSKSINVNDMLQGSANATSGIDRLLMMIEKFEASQDDIDLYRNVEQQGYEKMVKWHNVMREVQDGLSVKVDGPAIPDDSEVMVNYGGPDMVQSKKEHLDWIEQQMNIGLMSSVEAIEALREVDEESAKNILSKISEVERMDLNGMQQVNREIAEGVDIDELQSDEEG